MTHTHFHDDHEHIDPGRAYSFERSPGGGWHKSVLSFANAGATSLFTTAGDLARWLHNLEAKAVGGERAIATLLQKGVLNDGKEIDYAFGIAHGKHRGLPTLAHGGADAGFRSMVLYFPEQRFGVVVLANAPAVDPGRRAAEVAALFLGDRMEPLPEKEKAAAAVEPIVVATEVLDRYVGAYRLDALGAVIKVYRRESRLLVEVPGEGEIALTPVSEREFAMARLDGRLAFAAPEGGRSPSVVARIPGQELTATRFEPTAGLDLAAYAGWYLSPELETLYRISAEDGRLTAHHVRNADIELLPVAKDEFQGNQWYFGKVRFERDGEGAVAGFRLSGGRVRNLGFRRVDLGAFGLE